MKYAHVYQEDGTITVMSKVDPNWHGWVYELEGDLFLTADMMQGVSYLYEVLDRKCKLVATKT
jgi:hypothetical protein